MILKKVFGVIAFVMFFLAYGTVGGIEQSTIPLLQGSVMAFAFIGLFGLFSRLAGGFDPIPEERRKPREIQAEVADTRSSRTGREGPGPSGRFENHC